MAAGATISSAAECVFAARPGAESAAFEAGPGAAARTEAGPEVVTEAGTEVETKPAAGAAKLAGCGGTAAACARSPAIDSLAVPVLGTVALAGCAPTFSFAAASFRTRLTAVRIVLRAWSFATGLVRISSAPSRNAVGRPARPSTMAMGTGLLPFFPRRQTSKISLAAGKFSQSTSTRSKLREVSFWAADVPSRGRSQVTDISSKTPVIALTAWSSGDNNRARGIALSC